MSPISSARDPVGSSPHFSESFFNSFAFAVALAELLITIRRRSAALIKTSMRLSRIWASLTRSTSCGVRWSRCAWATTPVN